MNLMFFGTGIFPLNMFKTLHLLTSSRPQLVRSLCLATNISKDLSKKKQKESIIQYAIDNKIKTYIIDNQPDTMWQQFLALPKNKADLGLVCNFGYMLPSEVIDEFRQGMIVTHPSLLPKYRGASPIQRALMAGESETGVSFIEISKEKFDAGKILIQSHVMIDPVDRYKELSDKLSDSAARCVEDLLQNLSQLKQDGLVQDESLVTKAPKIKADEVVANFKKYHASKIVDQYRGLYGTNSHMRTSYASKTIFFEDLKLITEKELKDLDEFGQVQPGTLMRLKKREFKKFIYVRCLDSWVRMDKFRFGDRSLVQESYTFIDQFMDKSETQHQFE